MKSEALQSTFPFSVQPTPTSDENQDLLSVLESQSSDRKDWMDSGDLAQGAHMIAGDRANVSTVVPIFGDKSQEILQSNIDIMRQDALEGRSTLMPIHQNGNHYTAGFMTSSTGEDGKKKLHFLYNDSLGNEMPKNLREELGKDVEIIDMKILQQQNDFECGNHALANMQSFLDSGFGNEGFDSEALEEEMKKKKKLQPDDQKENLIEISPSESPQEKEKGAVFNETLSNLLGENYEGRIKRNQDGSIASIGCNSEQEAQQVSNAMKSFCDDIGLPCTVTNKNGSYVVGVKMPQEFKDRDPFSMKEEELTQLKQCLAKQKVTEEEKLKGADVKLDMKQAIKDASGVIQTLREVVEKTDEDHPDKPPTEVPNKTDANKTDAKTR